jgi:mannose-6-phosphate isomerase-like protein (cupin superfamily)
MPRETAPGVFLRPGEGEMVDNPIGGPLTFKLRGAQTDGALTAFESIAPPGEGPPLHLHENQDEIWYAFEGTFRVRLDTEVREAPAGTFVFAALPADAPFAEEFRRLGAEVGMIVLGPPLAESHPL